MNRSFLEALQSYVLVGVSVDFRFAEIDIFLSFGEELPDALYRAVRNVDRELAIADINDALTGLNSSDTKLNSAAYYKALEMIVLVAGLSSAVGASDAFVKTIQSEYFKSLEKSLRLSTISHFTWLAENWCYLARNKNGQDDICNLLNALIPYLSDPRDVFVCLLILAKLETDSFSEYFRRIFNELPGKELLSELINEYSGSEKLFKKIGSKQGHNILSVLQTNMNKNYEEKTLLYRQVFGIDSRIARVGNAPRQEIYGSRTLLSALTAQLH